MRAMEFIEVLEEQIRREIASELRAEFEAKAARPPEASRPGELAETWLVANTPTSRFAREHAGLRAYHTHRSATPLKHPASRIEAPKHEPRIEIDSPEAMVAYELLARFGGGAPASILTASELKSLWRRAALEAHPDRHATASPEEQRRQAALFRELAEAYSSLLKLFRS